jgi:hypothetical protein
VTCSDCEYAEPTDTGGSVETTIFIGGAATEIVKAEDLLRLGLLASVSVRLKEKFPLAAGVPVMIPVEEDSETPEGRLPAEMCQA